MISVLSRQATIALAFVLASAPWIMTGAARAETASGLYAACVERTHRGQPCSVARSFPLRRFVGMGTSPRSASRLWGRTLGACRALTVRSITMGWSTSSRATLPRESGQVPGVEGDDPGTDPGRCAGRWRSRRASSCGPGKRMTCDGSSCAAGRRSRSATHRCSAFG